MKELGVMLNIIHRYFMAGMEFHFLQRLKYCVERDQ